MLGSAELHSMRWLGSCCRFIEVVREISQWIGSLELYNN